MEFTAKRKTLLEWAGIASKVCGNIKTIPILSHALIKADNETVTIYAADMDMGIRLSMKAEAMKDGEMVVPLARLISFIGASQAETVVFSSTQTGRLLVQADGARMVLPCLDGKDFPAPNSSDEFELRLSGSFSALKGALTSTAFAAESGTSMRLTTKAVYFRSAAGITKVAAANGHRLAVSPIVAMGSGEWALSLPRKMAMTILSLKEVDDAPFSLMESDRHVVIEMPGIRVESRKLVGQVPDFMRLLADPQQLIGTLTTKSVIEALSQASITGGDVVLRADLGGGFEVSSVGEQGEFNGNTGGKAEVAINTTVWAQYIADFLRLATGESVLIYQGKEAKLYKGQELPRTLRLVDGENCYVVQPLMPKVAA